MAYAPPAPAPSAKTSVYVNRAGAGRRVDADRKALGRGCTVDRDATETRHPANRPVGRRERSAAMRETGPMKEEEEEEEKEKKKKKRAGTEMPATKSGVSTQSIGRPA